MTTWSPVTSAASDDSSTSSDDDEPLTVDDIEKWHSRTTTVQSRSSFNTDTSTLENYEQNINKGASNETEGSGGSSAADNAEGDYASNEDMHIGSNDDRSLNTHRHVVAGLPWTDDHGYEGMYTGEVNDDNVPDGLGLIRYYSVSGENDDGPPQQEEGEWRNGTLIRKRGIQNSDINVLSTIEEEKSHKSPSIKYTDEFANYLATKQIGVGDDAERRNSQSMNSMDAHTTGENSARDFGDESLYSSTSTRQSQNLNYASDSSHRRSNLYSSTNSRQMEQHHHQPTTKRSPDDTTTFEESDSESARQSISSGDNYIDYSYRDSQQTQNQMYQDMGYVAEDGDKYKSRSNSRSRSRDKKRRGDYNNEGNQRGKVPHETIDAIQKLVHNDSQVEYDSDESSDDEDLRRRNMRRSSAMFDWHLKDDQDSTGSAHPLEGSDDEMRPSNNGTHSRDEFEEHGKRRSSRFSRLSRSMNGSDGNGGSRFRSRKWCYIFSACCLVSILGISLLSWGLVRMKSNKRLSENANMNLPNSQSTENDGAGTKISLSWEVDVPCADVTIDITTDQYGNETSWVLYRVADASDGTKMPKATRTSFEVGYRRRLRPKASSNSNRNMQESGYPYQVRSGGPYMFMNEVGISPIYTSSVCLPEGHYNFVVSDANGICCEYGLGQYSLFFNNGRTIRESQGIFQEKEMTPFVVTSDDVSAAMVTSSPSQSLSPSNPPPVSLSPTIAPNWPFSMTTIDDIQAGTGNSYGLIFDIEMKEQLLSLTVLGMDILLDTDGPISYEILTRVGSWRDLDMSLAISFQQSFESVATGTTTEGGLIRIPMDDLGDSILSSTETRRTFWISLNGEGLVYKDHDGVSLDSVVETKQKSSNDFDLFYGRAIMHDPFANPRQDFQEDKGFVGRLWYSTIPKPTENSGNGSVSLNLAPQSLQPTPSVSVASFAIASMMMSPPPSIANPPMPTYAPAPTPSEPTEVTTLSSIVNSSVVTENPISTPTPAPSMSPTTTAKVTSQPTASDGPKQPPIVNVVDATSAPSMGTIRVTIQPSSTSSSPPSTLPSSSPSQSSYTAAPTRFFPSASPTATTSPSSKPSIFNPLLNLEVLDSLSVPYSLSHILVGEIHNETISRRLQEEASDFLFGFSSSVSADMSFLAVGAPNAPNENGNRTGAVFLYSMDASDIESAPELLQVIYGSNADDEFGNDVKLSSDGNRLVVGSRSENFQEGAIRIYEYSPEFYEWYPIRTIVGAGEGFRAGWSVAISGDGNVVAMGSTKGSKNDGGLVITYVAPDWTLQGSIIEAKTSRDVLGFSVALNGDGTMVAVGSVKAANPDRVTNAGRAEVFAFNGTSWSSVFEVYGETKQAYVGSSVALSADGSLFVVGGRGYTTDGGTAPALGRCRIYERTEDGQYELKDSIIGAETREELGWSASISYDGNKVACGGKGGKMLELGKSGVARVWDRGSLTQSEILPRGERFASVDSVNFGSSVSLSSDGSSLVVGATSMYRFGAVQIFGTGSQTSSSSTGVPLSTTDEDEAEFTASPSISAVVTSTPTTATKPTSMPTSSSIPSAKPTVFDPLLDLEQLDNLSSPYRMNRFLEGEVPESFFGFSSSVSADMSFLAVGAPNAPNENGNRTGAVFLYSMDASDIESAPELLQVIYGSNADDEFGNDVQLSDDGNRLVVGSRSENEQQGAIRMYNLRGTKEDDDLFWDLSGTVLGDAGFRAGWSVAISGDGNVVAMGSTKGGPNEGGIVSTYVAPNWQLLGTIIEAKTPRDVLGFSVALNGDGTMVAVGGVKAPNPDRVANAGRAEIFALNGTAWSSVFEVYGDTRQGYDGSSVALSSDGNLFVVGGRGYTTDGGTAPALGRCRIYERTGDGQYELLHTILGENEREELGWSSSMSNDGDKVACGGKGGKMSDWGTTGVARVWDRVSLKQSEILPRGERFASVQGSGFGSSVSLSGDGSSLVAGAWEWNSGNVTSIGSVFSFSTF